MAKTLANYDPLVQIPSGMTPAGADFPIVESHDILVGENDKRLDAKLDDIDSAIGNVGQTPIATQLSSKVNTGDIVTSVAATGSTSNNKIPSETAVRAAIEAKTINVDSTVTQGSTNAVSGGAVHTQLATKQDTLTFDTTPTASSSNPVTSGGVKSALDTKQDTLTFDTTPTASSSNPVTSGGVKAALDNKQNTLTYETTPIVGSVNPVTSTGIRNAIDTAAAQNLGAMQAQYTEFVADADAVLGRASSLSNGMVACSNIAAETTVGDTRILLYTGTTNSKYTNGHWYYNSAASNAAPSWTDGGAVGSAPTIDNTLTVEGAAANSKAVGDAIENIVTISNTQPGSNSGNKVWIKETTSEEVQIPTYAEHIAKANKADIATNNESDNGSGTITASKKYAIGDHFYINNTNTSSENYGVSTLYKATAAIASGDAIVVGTNCEASKVADEITSLSNDIDTVKADLGALTNRFSEHAEHIEITEDMVTLDTYWNRAGVTVADRVAYDGRYCTISPIRVNPGETMYYHMYCGSSNKQRPVLYVQQDMTIIRGIAIPNDAPVWADFEDIVPEGAYYVLLTTYDGSMLNNLDVYYMTGVDIEDTVAELVGVAESLDAQDVLNRRFEGLNVAIIGDSISTNGNAGEADSNAVEIRVQSEDVGQTLRAYLAPRDVSPNGLSLGGHTFTSDEIGAEVEFVPVSEDVGKPIGVPSNYNSKTVKTWWEVASEALGFVGIPVCWSGSSITSHEGSNADYVTSYAWHDAQIRKCGIRTAGSMTRTAPDVIIIYRGTNDFSHSEYAKLTSGYFDSEAWEYPTTDVITGGFGFKEGYSLTIKKLRAAYPTAVIMCCTLPVFKRVTYNKYPTRNGLYTLPQFNKAIREVADFFGCGLIEFDKCGITFENCYSAGYITDSSTIPTHPSDKGHYVMGQKAIKDLVRYMQDMDVQTPATYTP